MLLIDAVRAANADAVGRQLDTRIIDDFTLGVMATRSIDLFADRWGVDSERRLFWERLEICVALGQRYGPNRVLSMGTDDATLLQYAMRKVPGYPESPSFRASHPRFSTQYADDARCNAEESDDDYDRGGLPKNPILVTWQLVDALISRAGANPVAVGVFACAVEFGLHELMVHPRIANGAHSTRWSLIPLMRRVKSEGKIPLARVAATLRALLPLEQTRHRVIDLADPCDRWTALHCFADYVSGSGSSEAAEEEIMRLLLELGADPLLTDALGQRALHYAAPASRAAQHLREATERAGRSAPRVLAAV